MGESVAGLVELASSVGSAVGEAASSFGGSIGEGISGLGSAAGEAGSAAGAAGGIGDIVGSGSALFGGTTGLEGTLAAGGSGMTLADLVGGTPGLGALGTAADFMGSGFASGGSFEGIGLPGAAGGVGSAQPTAFGGVSSNMTPNVANANAGASVFDTGMAPVANSNITGAGSTAGLGASSVAAPSGVTGAFDPTAAAGAATSGATAGATSGATAASPSIVDTLKNAGSSAVKSLTANPLGTAIAAGGLGYNILSGQKQSGNQKALSADAAKATANSDRMVASGEALQKYLTDGTLPQSYQAQVDQAIDAAKTTAISNAAAQGLPTDPTKNTALAATLAKIDASRANMQAQVASQLFSSGSSLVSAGQAAAGLSGNLYQTLVQNDTASAANTGKAIANLAAALNGKSSANAGGITISTG